MTDTSLRSAHPAAPALALALLLSACATPTVTLKHAKTGQVVTCGGGTTGSWLGGAIGHHLEKSKDADCVRNHEARGFKRL